MASAPSGTTTRGTKSRRGKGKKAGRSARVPPGPGTALRDDRAGREHAAMPKSGCPISQTQFLELAEPLKITINGQDMLAEVKSFSTGSFGWYLNGKTVITVGGKPLSVQIGMNLTVVGSKEAER
jgi:hypothetical protein